MDPITLASLTTAVATLALDAAKEVASDTVRHTWGKIKGWLGWTETPATKDLAAEVAKALAANTATAAQIVAELKTKDTGIASRLASEITINITQTTGTIHAGGKVTVVQGKDFASQGDMNIGGG